jgi:hypothetical protein
VKRKEGHLHSEGKEEAQSDQTLLVRTQRCGKKNKVVRASGQKVQVQYAKQHEERTE